MVDIRCSECGALLKNNHIECWKCGFILVNAQENQNNESEIITEKIESEGQKEVSKPSIINFNLSLPITIIFLLALTNPNKESHDQIVKREFESGFNKMAMYHNYGIFSVTKYKNKVVTIGFGGFVTTILYFLRTTIMLNLYHRYKMHPN